MDKPCIVYVTAPDKDEAVSIARMLVDKKLAACVNIIEKVTSVYRWDGKINEDDETVLFIKTRDVLFTKISVAIKNVHSYDRPCIMMLPVSDAVEDFADWILSETCEGENNDIDNRE